MKKKLVAAALALAMVSSTFTAFAEEGTATEIIMQEGDPDFSAMTVEEWEAYEFNKDYAEVFSDVTSYDHEELRVLLDSHWNMYTQTGIPDIRTLSDEESRELLAAHHNLRAGIEPLNDVEEKRIYLWPEGKVPTVTEYTENAEYAYADDPDFQPYMLEFLVGDGVDVKGAVVISAGGGHAFRSNVEEAYEVAQALNSRGYQCFIVNYRVDPYTDEESALDVARAVKIVRANAESYGIEEDRIATAGFSYGGIVTSLAADLYSGETNASVLVADYVPDEIDEVSADQNAYLAIYSVTPDEITNENFPATFFTYGAEDATLWDWGFNSYNLLRDAGITAEIHTMSGVPHGFGAGTDAGGNYYENAAAWTMLADNFLQDVYEKADLPAEEQE
ncbi:MAG: alpha/beta hydrolase [Eubacteriales bacterium]|nr:alpha/beta hydrolase [Eubacteriales bacterium]